ncbi:MAG: BMP family protein, partial [Anaerolineae bacterium]
SATESTGDTAATEDTAASSDTAADAAAEETGPFRVAVVMPSPTNDLAFSQSMFDALTAIQDEMGADNFEFVYADGMFVVDDAAAAIRDWASQGFDLIIAHGSQYGASLQEIAPDFPDVSFAWGTAGDTFDLPNVYAYEANSHEGGYVNGVLAASLSESGTIGVVGPLEVGDAKLYVNGFIAGARATNPGIQVNVNYIGSFSDVALASEAAQTHAEAGADALTGTAQMVVGAIGVAEEAGIPWFGTQANQTELAPSIVVANQVYDWTVVLDQIIANIKNGVLGGESYAITLANGGLVMEYNDAFDLPAEARAAADAAVQGIIDGSTSTSGEAAPEAASEPASDLAGLGPFRVAVVMPSPTNDLAFSQSMFDALTAIQDEMGADNFEFVYADGMFVVDDAAAAIRDWASQGFDLIIAHGSQYGASLQEIAPDFPDVSFAWGTAGDTFDLPNVYAYEANSHEGGYVNGVLAASLSESGTIGVVGPLEVGDAKLYVNGFIAGARATNPGIQVNVNYIGSFSDVALASEAAQTHAEAGADALTGTAQMVVGAIGVAEEAGIPWFGTQANQTELAPSIVVANQVYDWTVVLKQILRNIGEGNLGGESYAITLANGGLVMEYNDAFDLPAEARAAADAAVQGIIDGSIQIDLGE